MNDGFELKLRSNLVIEELTLSAFNSEGIPESPRLLSMKCNTIQNQKGECYYIILMFNSMRDELTFSASANEDAPESPILLSMECETK